MSIDPDSLFQLEQLLSEQCECLLRLKTVEVQRRKVLLENIMADIEPFTQQAVDLAIEVEQLESQRLRLCEALCNDLFLPIDSPLGTIIAALPADLQSRLGEVRQRMSGILADLRRYIEENGQMVLDALRIARLTLDSASGKPVGPLSYASEERTTSSPILHSSIA